MMAKTLTLRLSDADSKAIEHLGRYIGHRTASKRVLQAVYEYSDLQSQVRSLETEIWSLNSQLLRRNALIDDLHFLCKQIVEVAGQEEIV